MGCQTNKEVMPSNQQCFRPHFTANLKKLFEYYLQVVNFVKESKLFSMLSKQSNGILEMYMNDPQNYDKDNFNLRALNAICKLHPLQYRTTAMTKEWIITACQSHRHFVENLPLKKIKFEQCYRNYVEFLYLCSKQPKKIIVANKLADFMWHSHMQDNQNYKIDTIKMIGSVLDHRTNFEEKQIRMHMEQTETIENNFLKLNQRSQGNSIQFSNEIDYNFEYLAKIQIKISKEEMMKLYSIASDGDYGGIYSHAAQTKIKKRMRN